MINRPKFPPTNWPSDSRTTINHRSGYEVWYHPQRAHCPMLFNHHTGKWEEYFKMEMKA